MPVIEGAQFQRSERGPRTFAVKTIKQDRGVPLVGGGGRGRAARQELKVRYEEGQRNVVENVPCKEGTRGGRREAREEERWSVVKSPRASRSVLSR